MKKVIFDVDTGIDDALAMAYALNSPELQVLGFTTCFGNVSVEEATRNTLAILELMEKSVPVYAGAAKPLVREPREGYAKRVHGEDGLGNVLDFNPTTKAEVMSAADFIIEQVKKLPHEITIIAVGPLTNLMLAIQKEPEIKSLIKEVVIMGGAVYVPGNKTPYAEANIITDPEAAEIVLSSGMPITLVGLDVTLQTLLPKSTLGKWRETNSVVAQFFANMTEFYMDFYESNYPGIGGCGLHDPLAVGVAIDSSFVETKTVNVRVITEGEEVGKTVPNLEVEPKVQVCTEVDADRFVQHFLERVIK
ncbi:nucleoside hydrolase [Ferdinandcohnia quinoae]|uniref:Nucleoside hydrolase n=1 Tax=Fredinandcohnia quinoae TaxID=2918902 RepID=A0AAW5DZ23_9BACI|nr:nucleoside hydrolase [Fredinandcohnia sp. SECRCQ15]MCH1624569.1 nucleoside hydrolase [Fredinandcohnia sp. SECRCQ15]